MHIRPAFPEPTLSRRLGMALVSAVVLAFTSTLHASSLITSSKAPSAPLSLADVDERIARVQDRLVGWRQDIHQHPELGNHEFRTAALVADHLHSLGLDEVRTGIARTGVVGVLKGGRPGAVVALRADMDALPIREATGLPFASTVEVDIEGTATPVMHACGHDAHTAILMATAEVLAGMREQIPGTIMFVFQPAEEGVAGEVAGAALMLQEGIFEQVRPDAMFALHVEPGPVGQIDVRPGPFLASATAMQINLQGHQTHAGRPWEGTDLVNLSADIVKSLATLSSRQVSAFEPHVVSIGSIQAGNRNNILPGHARLLGTIRTYNLELRDTLKHKITQSVNNLTDSYNAQANVTFEDEALVTYNDPEVLQKILPALKSSGQVNLNPSLRGAAEDFSFFSHVIPSVYYILGSTREFTTQQAAPTNHSDRFDIDEAVLPLGVRTQVLASLEFLHAQENH